MQFIRIYRHIVEQFYEDGPPPFRTPNRNGIRFKAIAMFGNTLPVLRVVLDHVWNRKCGVQLAGKGEVLNGAQWIDGSIIGKSRHSGRVSPADNQELLTAVE